MSCTQDRTFPARVDSGAAKTRKELGKTGKKQETENLTKPHFRARKTRNNRERIKAKAEKKQRQNKERTRKRSAFVP
jgi:hypothetical protein